MGPRISGVHTGPVANVIAFLVAMISACTAPSGQTIVNDHPPAGRSIR
jgi:hypothetical protein